MLPLSKLSPDLVQTVLDVLPAPVFFKDRAGVYRGGNKAFCAFIGRPLEQVIGMTVYDVAPPDLARVYEEADEALMRAGGEQRYEAQVVSAAGEERHVMFHKVVTRDAAGEVTGLVGLILDITDRKAMERRLADMASIDSLTGLMNRGAIMSHLEAKHHDRRHQNQVVCVMMCDVDHFKSINDRYGHAMGDEVLRQVANVLRKHLREEDAIGRVGGEEFLVVLDSADMAKAHAVAERLRQAVAEMRLFTGGATLSVTVSIGLAQSRPADESWSEVVARADGGLYEAKNSGRDRVVISTERRTAAAHYWVHHPQPSSH